ncbi:hypothetical protein TSMEX_008963 [Taenia solium]|eukprot:TsM_000258000 transcript=TsM_000258000 gene=TsM_000258000
MTVILPSLLRLHLHLPLLVHHHLYWPFFLSVSLLRVLYQ